MFYWAKTWLLSNVISTFWTSLSKICQHITVKSSLTSPVIWDLSRTWDAVTLTSNSASHCKAIFWLYIDVKESLQLDGLRNWVMVVIQLLAKEVSPSLLLNKWSFFKTLSLLYSFPKLCAQCFILFPAQSPAMWSPADVQSQHLGAIWLSLRSRQCPACLTKPPGAGLTHASGRGVSTRNTVKQDLALVVKWAVYMGGWGNEGQVQFNLKIKTSFVWGKYATPYV